MNYTKDNVIGLRVKHKNPTYKESPYCYEIVGISDSPNYLITKNYTTETVDENWPHIDDVNRWIEEGTWIVVETFSYEMY